MKKKVKISRTVRIGAASAVVAALATGSYFMLFSGNSKPIPVSAYTVDRVLDGDTFVTTEKQIIRLSSTEAPDINLCGGEEAKKELERMILNKPVYLKVVFNDKFHRLISLVYTPDEYVNEKMISGGFAYVRGDQGSDDILKHAAERARGKRVGIFSSKCTQKTNPKNPACNIKANISLNGRFYFLPDCGMYDLTDVQLYKGDQWFCTEKEEKQAGFHRTSRCP